MKIKQKEKPTWVSKIWRSDTRELEIYYLINVISITRKRYRFVVIK